MNGDVLQALEHALEEVRRLSGVVRVLIEKMEHGERLSDAALADYREQLKTVDEQRDRMQGMVATLWQQAGGRRPH